MICDQEELIKQYCKENQHPLTIRYEELMKEGKVRPMQTTIWTAYGNYQKSMVEVHICLICRKLIYLEVILK